MHAMPNERRPHDAQRFPLPWVPGGSAPGCAMLRLAMSEHEQRFELLADLGAMIAGEVELDDLLATFAARVARALGADRATLWLIDNATGEIRSRVATLPELAELRVPPGHGVVGHVARTGELMNNRDVGADPRWAEAIAQRIGYPVTSMLTAPIVRRGQIRGVLQVLNKREGAFTQRDEEFARVLTEQIGRALDYTTLRGDDASRGLTLRGRFNHVIGRSPEMAAVYEMIVRAAQADATVLLRGETGTGKGLLARAIHVNSARRPRAMEGSAVARSTTADPPFVHVDCTTLPAGLVESELFGHERGAYTGADSRVIGKVEAADKGTLFLDEIGELPLPLQGKLLRFVQERQFERVGGRETLTADVRIVAATNRDLAAMTSAGQFRSDLYFRLRVIEIEIPPLRARGGDDIADLAEHFVDQFARRYRKAPLRLVDTARPALAAYAWPGNVRELENTIERAVVMCQGGAIGAKDLGLEPRRQSGVFEVPPWPGTAVMAQPANTGANRPTTDGTVSGSDDTIRLPDNLALAEAERRYARAILERAGGNQSAAARQLGISRNKLARLLKP
jgi:Nif-specific regulatory protein